MNPRTFLLAPALFLTLSLLPLNSTAGPLKPTMKEMRLHYKQAMETDSPDQFNREVQLFIQELEVARSFNFSPERKAISLEGLNKVSAIVTGLPEAKTTNLAALQLELKQIDQLREEYHDKAKPGILDLLMDALKQALDS